MEKGNIVVTGGSGQLGRTLKKYFPDAKFISSSDYDLTREVCVVNMFDELKPEIVIHCAALVSGIQNNIKYPEDHFYDNVLMDTLVLRYSKINNVKRFIGILSTCAYPDVASSYPMKESQLFEGPPAPTNFSYGIAKRAMAVHIDAMNAQYGTKYQYLIPCNLYGHGNAKDAEKSHFLDALIEKIHIALTEKADHIDLMGTGIAKRQFMYAEDFARIIKIVVDNDITESFNCCPDENRSIKEIAEIAIETLCPADKLLHIAWDASKPDGQLNKQADNAIMKRLLPDFRFSSFGSTLRAVLSGKNKINEVEPSILTQAGQKFKFRGEEYFVGERIRVSHHYAGYKAQYPFMEGKVFLGPNNLPSVQIEIPANDIEQGNIMPLECWEKIVKVEQKNMNTTNENSSAPQQGLTFGQKAVGLLFNPSGDNAVDMAKQQFANIIDQLNDYRNKTTDGETKRL